MLKNKTHVVNHCLIFVVCFIVFISLKANLSDSDKTYGRLKHNLMQAVDGNNFEKAQEAFKIVYEQYGDKPSYIEDLFSAPQGSSILDQALRHQNFEMIYYFFDAANATDQKSVSDQHYIGYINSHLIAPKDDPLYISLKSKVLTAIAHSSVAELQSALKKLHEDLFYKYVPKSLIKQRATIGSLGKLSANYNTAIAPAYLADLYPSLLSEALTTQNNYMIYTVLLDMLENAVIRTHESITKKLVARILLVSILTTDPFSKKLILIQNPAISILVDKIIISLIEASLWSDEMLVPLLRALTDNGLTAERLEHNLAVAFTNIRSESHLNYLQDTLYASGFIKSTDQIIKHYNFHKKSPLIPYHLRNGQPKKALELFNALDASFLNSRNYEGNTLLINSIAGSRGTGQDDEEYLTVLTTIINKSEVNPNIAGADGKTPLITALQTPLLQNNLIPVIQLLLQRGADAASKDIYGKTALDYVKENKEKRYLIPLLSTTVSTRHPLTIDEKRQTCASLERTLHSLANRWEAVTI